MEAAGKIRQLRDIPVIGSGLGFRPAWRAALLGEKRARPAVDFLEITADHYLDAPAWKRAELEQLNERFVLIPHALDLSIGSAEGIDPCYLAKLAELIEELDPPYWSEHLAFTKAGGLELGHLAPLPWSHEAVDQVARNAEVVRKVIDRPLILENITCELQMPGGELSEGRFLSEALEAAECGWLLDITNLHINAVNHGDSIMEFLEAAPLDRVIQLHYVGFFKSESGRLVDNHGGRVNDEIWDLMKSVFERSNPRGAILERDQNLPVFAEIMREVEYARSLGKESGIWA